MTTAPQPPASDHTWERVDAPRISNAYWGFVVVLFVLWVLFLVAMAVHRWMVTLQ